MMPIEQLTGAVAVGRRRLFVVVACGAIVALAISVRATPAAAQVPSPMVEGPITGGNGTPFVAATTFDLAQVGYVQEEYFISGTATAYTSASPLTSDGNWTVTPASTAAYKTRILVHRPVKRSKFKGTVVVEWLNVSAGVDSAPDWITAHTGLVRDGMVWMGVSAQRLGVEGGSSSLGLPGSGLKTADPVRYGSLVHPGDSFSYDIFSQAGQAIRQPSGVSPLGGLARKVKKLIAVGESQSAFRLTTFINAVDSLALMYDGYLVHSRGAAAAPLSEAPQPGIGAPRPTFIRSDVRVPVLTFETETDLINLGYFSDRQPDSERFRLWEVAGTAHADTYTLSVGSTDLGKSPSAAELVLTSTPFPGFTCGTPINSGPQHFVLNAAIAALNKWVVRGTLPPQAPRLDVVDGTPPTINLDAFGNALGGIRTPAVDVPIAVLSGLGQTGSVFCSLFGTTVPFDDATLAVLYPKHRAYVSAVNKAANAAVKAGFLLRPDAKLIKAAAKASAVGN
jgi:hypothetical protein